MGFLDNPGADLRKRILSHMNSWSKSAYVEFTETSTDSQVRIARTPGEGYYSYLGTDVLLIRPNDQTMNLDSFTMDTDDSEFYRVVRHETGHTLGFPHEHMRRELVERLDRAKTIESFRRQYAWPESMTVAQVLTPLEDAQLMATAHADELSIMCYQIPGEITKDGQPILGGLDIDPSDYDFAAKLYPKR